MGNWNYDNCASWPLFQLFRVRASYNLIVLLIRVIQIGTWPIIFTRCRSYCKPTFIPVREIFASFATAPSSRVYFFDENQFLPNSYYHNNTKEDKTWSRKQVTAKQFIRSYSRNKIVTKNIWFTVYIPIYQYWSFSSHYVSMCIYVGQGSFQYILHFKLYQCNSNKRSLNLNYLSSHLQVLVIKSTLLSRIQTKWSFKKK